MRGHARFRRRSVARSTLVTAAAGCRVADYLSVRAITSDTGPTADHVLEPRAVVPPASPRRSRRGLSGRTTIRRRVDLQKTGRTAAARHSIAAGRAPRSCRSDPSNERGSWTSLTRANRTPRLAGRASRRGLRDRRPASASLANATVGGLSGRALQLRLAPMKASPRHKGGRSRLSGERDRR